MPTQWRLATPRRESVPPSIDYFSFGEHRPHHAVARAIGRGGLSWDLADRLAAPAPRSECSLHPSGGSQCLLDSRAAPSSVPSDAAAASFKFREVAEYIQLNLSTPRGWQDLTRPENNNIKNNIEN